MRGFIRLAGDELDQLEILRCIYELESSRISGPASYRKKLDDVLWSMEHLEPLLRRRRLSIEAAKKLVDRLVTERQMMVVPATEEQPERFLSRLGETIRLLGHTYEYWTRGWPTIRAVRWIIEDKEIPRRSIAPKEFMDELEQMVIEEIGGGDETENLRTAIEIVIIAVSKKIMRSAREWKKARYSRFQVDSTKSMVRAQFMRRSRQIRIPRTQMLTAGVGSGKTYGFTIPMLISAVEGILGGYDSQRVHLFLYPRTALAKDQADELKKIAKYIKLEDFRVLFEHKSYHTQQHGSVRRGIEQEYKPNQKPAQVIVTTLETLKRRLFHPLFVRALAKTGVVRVVLDEIHLVEGLSGNQIVRLMARLKAACETKDGPSILWTGSSATVATPAEHAYKVFGVPTGDVEVIEPESHDMDFVGLAHHVFLRIGHGVSHIGALVNSTSILIHNRRHALSNRENEEARTMCFADTLDALGRWNADLRENERTEHGYGWNRRGHPEHTDINQWEPMQREIPYAMRYINPLTRRINAIPGTGEPFDEVLHDAEITDPCTPCRRGERIIVGTCSPEEMKGLGVLVYRQPTQAGDTVRRFAIRNPVFETTNDTVIGTLDLCPYLQSGACHWFPLDDFSIGPLPQSRFHEFTNVARSRIHSSKTAAIDEVEGDLASIVFSGTPHEIYDVGPWSRDNSESIDCDIVLASPSLEVGVDIGNLTESVMYKAIRNVASYRQKAGRIGREIGSDILNITLLADSPIDLHYYRQPMKLTSTGHLDPVPLKEYNQLVLASALYSGVWDFLAMKGVLPEAVPWRDCGVEFRRLLGICVKLLRHSKSDVATHLAKIFRSTIDSERISTQTLIDGAIEQALTELEFLLAPVKDLFTDKRIEVVSDILVAPLCRRGIPELTSEIQELKSRVDSNVERYRQSRRHLEPISLGLANEFHKIDQMVRCGWDLDALSGCLRAIEQRIDTLDAANSDVSMEDVLEDIRDAARNLNRISSRLETLRTRGYDPRALYLLTQFSKLYNENIWKAYYLSFIMSDLPVFKILKKESYYVRPDNLFTNPYEHEVEIIKHGPGNRVEESTVLLGEVLFGFLPGTWTFRLGKIPYKTLVGALIPRDGNILDASIDEMSRIGQTFVPIPGSYPIPLDSLGRRVELFRPTSIHLNKSEKYVKIRPGSTTIVDGDEEQKGGTPRPFPIKIPRTFASKWYHLIPEPGRSIQLANLGIESLAVTDEVGNSMCEGNEARGLIRHPIVGHLLEDVKWHDNLDVTEYVYQISRAYNTAAVSGVTLRYRTRGGSGLAGLGRRISTEGVSLELNAATIARVVQEMHASILSGAPVWIPSALKAIEAMMVTQGTDDDESIISHFAVRDLITCVTSLLLPAIQGVRSETLVEILRTTLDGEDSIRRAARDHYASAGVGDALDVDSEQLDRSQDEVTSEILEARVEEMIELRSRLLANLDGFPEFLGRWIPITLLNTFGTVALRSLREFAGVHTHDVGYTFDIMGIESDSYRIFLYDNNPGGNGCARVLHDYMHIIHSQRTMDSQSKYLPSDDYLTVLERNLLQCPQFHQDINALEMFRQKKNGDAHEGHPELSYVRIHSEEILSIAEDVWATLGVDGPDEAWKLPLIRRLSAVLPRAFPNLYEDDILRSSGICWNGCPECVDIHGGIMAALAGNSFIDKALLDHWVTTGFTETKEYSFSTLNRIASGDILRGIGAPSKVTMVHRGQVIRDISLPFTIGFSFDRNPKSQEAGSSARLLIRTSDIAGLEAIATDEDEGYPLPSSGFGRLVWFELLMTSYLDCVGISIDGKKEIDLVFYAATQIPLNTTGLSPDILATLDYYRRERGFYGAMGTLSEVLNWLVDSDFRIRLCIDKDSLSNEATYRLLRDLDIDPRMTVYVTNLKARMHQKILLTPIGGIIGSSNLTLGGTLLNIESVSYRRPGTGSFRAWKLKVNDTIKGSEILDLTNL